MNRNVAIWAAVLAVLLCGCRLIDRGRAGRADLPESVRRNAEAGKFLVASAGAGAARDREAMIENADRKARSRFGEEISDYVGRMTRDFLTRSPSAAAASSPVGAEFADLLAAEVAAGILRESMRYDIWEGPQGELYVLYRLPIAVVNEKTIGQMPQALAHVNPFGADAAGAVAAMEGFLAAHLRERLTEAARVRPEPADLAPELRVPGWLDTGQDERYSGARYLSAIGVGHDEPTARVSAHAELAARLRALLAEKVRPMLAGDPESALSQNADALGARAFAAAGEDLVGTRIVERWHDQVTDTHYALGVLDRVTAGAVCSRRIAEDLQGVADRSASARNNRRAGNHVASLADWLSALQHARRAVTYQLQAVALSDGPAQQRHLGAIEEPVLPQAESNVRAALGQIRLEKTGGDDQWVRPGAAPSEPLELRAVAEPERASVQGLPLRLRLGPGGESLPALTDEDGEASWRLIRAPAAPGGRLYTTVAEVDLGRVAPEVDTVRFTPPRAEFRHVLRSRENTSCALLLVEVPAAGPPLVASMAEALRDAIRREGIELIPEDDALAQVRGLELAAETPDARIPEAFEDLRRGLGPGRFLLVIVGTVRTELLDVVPTSEGELHIFTCTYAIRILDPDLPGPDATIEVLDGRGRGAYTDDAREAARRARADAAAGAVVKLQHALRKRFGRSDGAR